MFFQMRSSVELNVHVLTFILKRISSTILVQLSNDLLLPLNYSKLGLELRNSIAQMSCVVPVVASFGKFLDFNLIFD